LLVSIINADDNPYRGAIRLNPADIFINLHNALPGASITWTPYLWGNIGIPVELDAHLGWGVLNGVQLSLLGGIEYFPLNSLFLDAKLGASIHIDDGIKPAFICKAGAGYQFIFGRGFLFTPGAGIVYNGHNGLGVYFNLALGYAYR